MRRAGIVPMRATAAEHPPTGEGWAFELKWDGYRTLAFVDVLERDVRLQSSNQIDVTARWPELGALWHSVNARSTVLDGEVVVLDDNGIPRFELLQRGDGAATYVVFDLLELDGMDATAIPYEQRRRLLREAVEDGENWFVPEHYLDGTALMDASRARGLEGVVAKRLDSPYVAGKRSNAWRKIKNRVGQEVVIGGWSTGNRGRASSFGALLVGVYEDGRLRYSGGVGTGFDGAMLDRLTRELASLATDVCPFEPVPPREVTRQAHWVRPQLVAQIAFTEWTFDGILRQASFVGLRDDKAPTDVVREPF
jgi:bifunctional non-homologous end joining protein LigD